MLSPGGHVLCELDHGQLAKAKKRLPLTMTFETGLQEHVKILTIKMEWEGSHSTRKEKRG